MILIDDEGYGDVGSYGATGFQTPNLDHMASKGMRFTNFYAAQPVCTASRAIDTKYLSTTNQNGIKTEGLLGQYFKNK
ncbi:sulfatase-like hydrolase/transferase [Formosa sp. PL04]|uniref:sulfatase-like hydrolase/transferase n=1 Tax=Formosa sp. PL04 TaxID=3081755 RepID=UPI002980E174|nr:sulfatase-like hydrolase/transferase [Formosa sp. PL04]MDW5289707.1 sulfatase-like hydrolase/transferase [Formosa sp. PL04]